MLKLRAYPGVQRQAQLRLIGIKPQDRLLQSCLIKAKRRPLDNILADNDPPDGDNNECCLASIADTGDARKPNWHGSPDTGACTS